MTDTTTPKRKTKLSLVGMLSRLSLASEDSLNLIVDTVNNPNADPKERLACAKFVLTQHASLLAQQERERMNAQTVALNDYRLRVAKREDDADAGVQQGRYLGMGEVSLEITSDD